MVLQCADSSSDTGRESRSPSEEQWAVEVLSRTESRGTDEEEEGTDKDVSSVELSVTKHSENIHESPGKGSTSPTGQLEETTPPTNGGDVSSKPTERDGEDEGLANKKKKRSKKTRKKKAESEASPTANKPLEVQVEDFAQTFKQQRALVQGSPAITTPFDFPLPDVPEEEKRKERLTLWFYFAAFWAIFFCVRCGWQYFSGNVFTYAL